MLQEVAQFYSDVLDPLYALPLFALIVIGVAARRDRLSRVTIGKQVVITLASYVVGLLIALGLFIQLKSPPSYALDLTASLGAFIGLGGLAVIWHHLGWHTDMVTLIAFILTVLIPFAAISPFWNISGHVSLIAAPSFYMLRYGRPYVLFIVIPLLMVPSRVIVNEHTVTQAVAALVMVSVLYAMFHRRGRSYVEGVLREVQDDT